MGIEYAYQILFEMTSIDRVLGTLAAHLKPGEREKLLAALPWQPEIDLEFPSDQGLLRERFGIKGFDPDITPMFRLDRELKDYYRERKSGSIVHGQLSFSLGFDLFAGIQLGVISLTSGFSRQSYALRDSPSIRKTLVEIAKSSGSLGLFFDWRDLDIGWSLCYPDERPIECPCLREGDWDINEKKPSHFERCLKEIVQTLEAKYWIQIGYMRVVYCTKDHNIAFRCDGGTMKNPERQLYFPTPECWDKDAPGWAKNKRQEILEHFLQWSESKKTLILLREENCFAGA